MSSDVPSLTTYSTFPLVHTFCTTLWCRLADSVLFPGCAALVVGGASKAAAVAPTVVQLPHKEYFRAGKLGEGSFGAVSSHCQKACTLDCFQTHHHHRIHIHTLCTLIYPTYTRTPTRVRARVACRWLPSLMTKVTSMRQKSLRRSSTRRKSRMMTAMTSTFSFVLAAGQPTRGLWWKSSTARHPSPVHRPPHHRALLYFSSDALARNAGGRAGKGTCRTERAIHCSASAAQVLTPADVARTLLASIVKTPRLNIYLFSASLCCANA